MVGGAKIKSVSSTSSFVHAVHAQFWSATIPLSVRELAEAFLGRNCAPISVQRYTWGSNSRRYQLTKSDKLKTWLDVVICWILHRWVWLFFSQGYRHSKQRRTDWHSRTSVLCLQKSLPSLNLKSSCTGWREASKPSMIPKLPRCGLTALVDRPIRWCLGSWK